MNTVFIDGAAGTTGLRIQERLGQREDISLIILSEEERKNADRRGEALNSSDVAILCLPDAAARESVSLVKNEHTVIIDASTAHRTAPGWVYGFPELDPSQEQLIAGSKRIAITGCHASGFVALVAPLVQAGALPASAQVSCFSLTGYSGGGKAMIAEYEGERTNPLLDAPRQYALTQGHKHVPEMLLWSGLDQAPLFCPIVADFYSGMEVTVPLFASQLNPGWEREGLARVYEQHYPGPVVSYVSGPEEGGFLSAVALAGKDGMEISLLGNEERLLLIARFDNLGKGASGAAVQCLNLALGLPATTGLNL